MADATILSVHSRSTLQGRSAIDRAAISVRRSGDAASLRRPDAAIRRPITGIDAALVGSLPTKTGSPRLLQAQAVPARQRVECLIEERLGSAMLTVSALCRWTGMSRSSLYRLFDGDGGVQCVIRARRLARVAEELRAGTTDKLAVVAERWGFCDAAYLARVFREVHGVTPSVYRTLHRPRP